MVGRRRTKDGGTFLVDSGGYVGIGRSTCCADRLQEPTQVSTRELKIIQY